MTNNFFLEDPELNEILTSGNFSSPDSKQMREFERGAACFWGTKMALSFCNATASLFTILKTLKLKEKSEILIPAYNFYGVLNAVRVAGGKPLLVDIDETNLCIDLHKLSEKINTNTKAVILLLPWGIIPNLRDYKNLCKSKGVKLIIDASHSHGATFENERIGKYCDALFASYGTGKLVSCGELGCMATDDIDMYDSAFKYSQVNRKSDFRGALLSEDGRNIGIKFRPTKICLRLGILKTHQFQREFENILEVQSDVIRLINSSNSMFAYSGESSGRSVYWKVLIRFKNANVLLRIQDYFDQNGIRLQSHQYDTPIYYCNDSKVNKKLDDLYPFTASVRKKLLLLPIEYFFSYQEVDKLKKTIEAVLKW